MDADTQQRLIDAARWAPSADNSQPWLYRWREDALELWIDATRSGGATDARYVLSDIALGACIENVCIQGRALGYRMDVEYFPNGPDEPLWVALLRWTEAEPAEQALADAIPHRCTDRRFPWSGPVDGDCKRRLSDQAAVLPFTQLLWIEKGPSRKAALRALWRAESLRFMDRDLHHEMFSSICFSVGRKGTCEEGLAPPTLAVEPFAWPIFKAARHWPVMRVLNWLGAAWVFGFRSAVLPIRLSPALGLLCVKKTDRTAILEAARALQRVWLQATVEGLAAQPYAAPGVLTLGFLELDESGQRWLGRIGTHMARVNEPGHGLVFLRVGRPKGESPPVSGRRPIQSFLANE